MRLIDADALMDEIKSLQVKVTGLRAGRGILNEYAKFYRESLLKSIDEQPTVYDIARFPTTYSVDKVIKELGELKMSYFLTIANTGDEKSDFAYENVGNALDKAIEIVKQGGMDDDVCEWKAASDGEFIQNPHTKRLFSNEQSMQNVYCNTCGKKIKIVGD